MSDKETTEERHDRRRKRDRLLEYVRVYWPLVIAMFFAVSTWAQQQLKVVEIDKRLTEFAEKQKEEAGHVALNVTKIAVLEANLAGIKDQVDDIKSNTNRILSRIDRISTPEERDQQRRYR